MTRPTEPIPRPEDMSADIARLRVCIALSLLDLATGESLPPPATALAELRERPS